MRKIFFLIAIVGLLALPAAGQGGFTTVTGTIVDPNNIPWAGGTISAQLIPASGGGAPTLNGISFTATTGSAILGPGGTFTMRLGDNGVILPSGSTWQFTINIAPGIPPPAGKGPQSFTATTAINCGANIPATCTSNQINITSALVPVPALGFATGLNPPGTSGPLPQQGSYVIYINGGITYARNNNTGIIDASGTDSTVVVNTAIANTASTCGTLIFKSGIYNFNTLIQENTGGFTHFYAVGIPSSVSPGVYCQWHFIGERTPPSGVDQFGTAGVQNTGVIFNITQTALNTVTSTNKVMGIWVRPDVVNGAGATIFIESLGVRFPSNQRGCITGIDTTQALDVDIENANVDTPIAESSLQFPVNPACVGTTGAGNIGMTTTASGKEENFFKYDYVTGWDVGFDIQAEHTLMLSSFALSSNHGFDVGVRGSAVVLSQPSAIINSACSTCARCLTFGTNINPNSVINIISFAFEDANSGFFLPIYHALETNPGTSFGEFSFTKVVQSALGLLRPLLNPFDGGGGNNFTLPFYSFGGLQHIPVLDTFTRANASTLGANWLPTAVAAPGTVFGFQIVGNTAQGTNPNAESTYIGQMFNGDQCAQVTVSAIDSSAGTNAQVFNNMSLSNFSNYGYFASHVAATGSGIFNFINGTQTILTSQTASVGVNAGDTLKLCHLGNKLYAYRNGALDTNIPTNPIADSGFAGGQPGIGATQDVNGAVSYTNFIANWGTNEYASTFNSLSNCVTAGSSAAASAVACGASAAGLFSIPITTPTSAVVTTTALGPNSEITVQQRLDTTNGAGAALGVTCNSTANATAPNITARTATSFTINFVAFAVNPGCYQFSIVNQ